MKKYLVFSVIFLLEMSLISAQVPQSPCPGIFQYKYDGNRWLGLIQIKAPVYLIAHFSVEDPMNLGPWPVQMVGTNGQLVRYIVYFPLQGTPPRLKSLIYYNQVLCSGPPEIGLTTSLRIQSGSPPVPGSQFSPSNPFNNFNCDCLRNRNNAFQQIPQQIIQQPPFPNIGNSFNNNQFQQSPLPSPNQIPFQQLPPVQPQPQYQQSPPIIPRPVVQEPFPPDDADDGSLNNVCGIPVISPAPLIFGGEHITRGDWPWIVALFVKTRGNFSFQCGGTLISKKLVITAAHCINEKGREPYKPKDFVAFMGRNNIIEWSDDGFISSDITEIYSHPDYGTQNLSYDSDLSILVLKSTISFTRFIRPICLWSFSKHIRDIEGQVGVVTGWGRNENGDISSEAKKVDSTIVSESECLRADESYLYITTNRTFCASGLKGEGPCYGDSGGGFVLKYNNKWYLRGIVSVTIPDPQTKSCNVGNHVVYTDVAQFDSWIMTIMMRYN